MAWQITSGNRIKWLWILSPTPTRKLATAACDCNLLHKTLESLLKLIKRKKVFSSRSSFFCLKSHSIALTRKRNPDMSLVKGKFHLEVWRLLENLSIHKICADTARNAKSFPPGEFLLFFCPRSLKLAENTWYLVIVFVKPCFSTEIYCDYSFRWPNVSFYFIMYIDINTNIYNTYF